LISRGEDQAFTLFHFQCTSCGAVNEYLYQHRMAVRPYLVSTACHECRTVNALTGITGTRVPSIGPDSVVTLSDPGDSTPRVEKSRLEGESPTGLA